MAFLTKPDLKKLMRDDPKYQQAIRQRDAQRRAASAALRQDAVVRQDAVETTQKFLNWRTARV